MENIAEKFLILEMAWYCLVEFVVTASTKEGGCVGNACLAQTRHPGWDDAPTSGFCPFGLTAPSVTDAGGRLHYFPSKDVDFSAPSLGLIPTCDSEAV